MLKRTLSLGVLILSSVVSSLGGTVTDTTVKALIQQNVAVLQASNNFVASISTNQNSINLWATNPAVAVSYPGLVGTYINPGAPIAGLPVWTNSLGNGFELWSNGIFGLGISHNKFAWVVTNTSTHLSYYFSTITTSNSVPGNNFPALSDSLSGATSIGTWSTNALVSGTTTGNLFSDWTMTSNRVTINKSFQSPQFPLANPSSTYLTVSPNGVDSSGGLGYPYATLAQAINDANAYTPPRTMFKISAGVNSNALNITDQPFTVFWSHWFGLGEATNMNYPPQGSIVFGDCSSVSIYLPPYNSNSVEPYVLVTNNLTFQNLTLPRLQFGGEYAGNANLTFTNLTLIDCVVNGITHTMDFHNFCYGLTGFRTTITTQADMWSNIGSATMEDCTLVANGSGTAFTPNANQGLSCVWIAGQQAGAGPWVFLGGNLVCSNGTTGTFAGSIYTNACIRIDTNATKQLTFLGTKLWYDGSNPSNPRGIFIAPGMTATNLFGYVYDMYKQVRIGMTNGVFTTNSIN